MQDKTLSQELKSRQGSFPRALKAPEPGTRVGEGGPPGPKGAGNALIGPDAAPGDGGQKRPQNAAEGRGFPPGHRPRAH